MKSLCSIDVGEHCRVKGLGTEGVQRRRMLDLGLVCGTRVEALHKSPSGDPVAYFIRGTVIALRREDAQKIYIEN